MNKFIRNPYSDKLKEAKREREIMRRSSESVVIFIVSLICFIVIFYFLSLIAK